MLHFKGLGMRNLQNEMRICQKSHIKVTKTVYVRFEFLWLKLRLSLKQILKFSFQPKIERKYFSISALGL